MQTVLEINQFKDYLSIAESLLDDYSAEDVVAAAIKLMQEGNKALEATQEDDIIAAELQNTGGRPGMVRLFFNVGRAQRISVKDIISTVAIVLDSIGRNPMSVKCYATWDICVRY